MKAEPPPMKADPPVQDGRPPPPCQDISMGYGQQVGSTHPTIPRAMYYNHTRLCMRVNLTMFNAIWSIHICVIIGVCECEQAATQAKTHKNTCEYLFSYGTDPFIPKACIVCDKVKFSLVSVSVQREDLM